jgi:secreted PhoX family phosphatase
MNADQEASAIGALIAQRISRRAVLGGVVTATALAGTGMSWRSAYALGPSSLAFEELARGLDTDFHVAPAHDAQVLIRWGDPVYADAPAFDPMAQTAAAQEKQFGYNNDFVAFMPLPHTSKKSSQGLLCVNHEFTNARMMFPGLTSVMQAKLEGAVGVAAQALLGQMPELSREQIEIEMAAHGHSVVEIRFHKGVWKVIADSPFNRRFSMLSTPMRLSGPAAGHARLKTSADPSGANVIGTLNNCAGGVTPWGTVLIAEENFNFYFSGDPAQTAEADNHQRYGIAPGKTRFQWARFHDRFNVEKEPNEPNRFGWVVEIDPYNSKSVPVKRTALGRFKHEAATVAIAPDGRVVVYTGDDERFQYVYRYVSTGRFDAKNRPANMTLLDDGVLSVAKFEADGRLIWMPLVWGTGPLTQENGFNSQADVLIETRRAAELLGATKMDRPEDIETNPVTGRVYLVLTNNDKREDAQKDAANPRAKNAFGHILELAPPVTGGESPDHAADEFRWDIFLLGGDPVDAGSGARYHPQTSKDGWLTTPDNIAFDSRGRMWIATDGANDNGFADGVWASDAEGPGRALTRHFLAAPRGAEMCGPCFTPDDATLFVAVQHPGQEPGSTFDTPSTRWPDFKDAMPPRPVIVAITAKGKPIGG